MKKDFLKYLTIPTIIMVFFVIMRVIQGLYDMHTMSDPDARAYYTPLKMSYYALTNFVLVIFVPTLLFTIAYKLTQLNLKNIIYALSISLAICIFNEIRLSFLTYVLQHYLTQYDDNVQILFVLYTSIFSNLIQILIITGISYCYARYCKLSVATLSKKSICLLYAGLLITFSISMGYVLTNVISSGLTGHLSSISFSENILIFLFCLVFLLISYLIYFTYYYFWTDTLLSRKDLSNYLYKIIFSYTLNTLLLTIIYFIIQYIAFKSFVGLITSLTTSFNFFLIAIIPFAPFLSYIFSILFFFLLLNISKSRLYRSIHCALYIIITIVTVCSGLSTTELIITYGLALFITSFSFYIIYLSNKIAINLCFKNANTQSINEV